MGWTVFKVLLAWTVLSVPVAILAGKVFKAHRESEEPQVPPGRLAPVGRRDYRVRPDPPVSPEPWENPDPPEP